MSMNFLLLLVFAFEFLFIQGTISVGVDATDLFDRYDEDFEEMPGGGFPHIEINKMHISQSIEVCIKWMDSSALCTFSVSGPRYRFCVLKVLFP